jgi:ferrous iron transport protein B
VGLNLGVVGVLGVALNRTLFHGERVAFIMELPLYHAPNTRTIGLSVWHNLVMFLRKAATVILPVSVIIWALSSYPGPDIADSLLGYVGRALEPVGAWMGLDWQMMVAMITSFVAKENVIATLGVLYEASEQGVAFATALRAALSPAAALAFLAAQMLFVPCVATVAAVRQETRSWGWTAASVGLLLGLSLLAGVLIYQGARLLGVGV